MCGRYSSSRNPADLADEFEVEQVDEDDLSPDYNVAPTKSVYAVLDRAPRARADQAEAEPEPRPIRQLRVVTWGLVPSWAKDPSIGNKLINARMETVAEKPAFKRAFASRRCLLPADGYYEWMGEKRGSKQPYFIHPRDGGILAMAGVYELWRDPGR